MKSISALCIVALLTGCASGTFTTRGAVTLAEDKVILCSQWGALPCIGTEMDPRDAAKIISAVRASRAASAP